MKKRSLIVEDACSNDGPRRGGTLSPRKGDSSALTPRPGGTVESGMGRRERLPHIWTGESACPTFISMKAGRRNLTK